MRKRALVLLVAASFACSRRLATPPVLFPVQQAWKSSADAGLASPLASDGERLFCARGDGTVEAVALASGERLWRAAPGEGWLSAGSAMLVLRSEDGTLRRLDPLTGAVAWSASSGVTGRIPALIDGDMIVVAGGGLVALAADDGRLVWRTTDGGDVTATPIASGARLFVGEEDGTLRCRDRVTGLSRWSLATGSSLRAAPLVHDGRVLVGTSDGRFLSVSPDDGRVQWRWRLGADVADAAIPFASDMVIFASYENILYALDRDNGHLRWRATLPSRPISAPLLIGHAVVVACQEIEVVAFDARTGRRLGAATVPAEIRSPPLFARNRLYLGLRDRSVLAYAVDLTPSKEVKLPPGPRPSPKPVAPGRERDRDRPPNPLQQPSLP